MANKHNLFLDDIFEIKKKFYQINSDNSLDFDFGFNFCSFLTRSNCGGNIFNIFLIYVQRDFGFGFLMQHFLFIFDKHMTCVLMRIQAKNMFIKV